MQALKSKDLVTLKTALAQVKELDLSGSYGEPPLLTAKQVLLLVKSLKSNNTLTELNLGNNKIGAAGGAAIAKSLKVNSTLTELNLGNNKIGAAGGAAIAESLKVNSTLIQLNLGENQIGDEVDKAIYEEIKINKAQQQLIAYHRNETFPKYLEMIKLDNNSSQKSFYLLEDCTKGIFTFLLSSPVTDSELELSGLSEQHDNT